jgi:hypothetical protein
MRFSKVEVIKTKENYFFLEWDVYSDNPDDIPAETVDDFQFKIYWSFDPASGFIAIQDEDGDDITIDGAIGPLAYTHPYAQYDFNKDRYYKIKMINKDDQSVVTFSEMVYIGRYKDGIHEVIKYNESLLYNNYHGEPSVIVKRKSTGARCTECWSSARQQRTKSHCETCNGTGFVTGYYQPIKAQISFDSDPKATDPGKTGESVFDSKRCRLSNYPIVRPKDLIINLDDYKRYVIVRVETTKLPNLSKDKQTLSRQNYIISQIVTLEELNTDDDEYRMDIDNIPQPDPGDDGGSGTLPQYSRHDPATVDEPLSIDDAQHISFIYNSEDFELVDGVFTLKGSGSGLTEVIEAAEVFFEPLRVVALDDDGKGILADSLTPGHMDRVIGIALNAAIIGDNLTVRKFGRISNSEWTWVMGQRIFLGEDGALTQTVPVSPQFWMPVAQPMSETDIDVNIKLPVIRH